MRKPDFVAYEQQDFCPFWVKTQLISLLLRINSWLNFILSYDIGSGSGITPCFKIDKPLVCLFVLLLYVPSQQLWSLRDGQFT